MSGVVLITLILLVCSELLVLSRHQANASYQEAYLPLNPGQAGSGYSSSDAWDYFHINSVDKDSEGIPLPLTILQDAL